MKMPIFANSKTKATATYKRLLKEGFRFLSGQKFNKTGTNLIPTFNPKDLKDCHSVALYKGAVIIDLFWDGEIEAHIRNYNLKKHLETFKIWEDEERNG